MNSKIIFTVLLLLCGFSGSAQEEKTSTGLMLADTVNALPDVSVPAEDTIYRRVQVKAEMDFNVNEFLNENLRYPKKAMRNGVHGYVVVEFVVEKDGRITNAKVVRGAQLGNGIPEEAIRVIEAMPRWIAGRQGGKPVRTYFQMPISFELLEVRNKL